MERRGHRERRPTQRLVEADPEEARPKPAPAPAPPAAGSRSAALAAAKKEKQRAREEAARRRDEEQRIRAEEKAERQAQKEREKAERELLRLREQESKRIEKEERAAAAAEAKERKRQEREEERANAQQARAAERERKEAEQRAARAAARLPPSARDQSRDAASIFKAMGELAASMVSIEPEVHAKFEPLLAPTPSPGALAFAETVRGQLHEAYGIGLDYGESQSDEACAAFSAHLGPDKVAELKRDYALLLPPGSRAGLGPHFSRFCRELVAEFVKWNAPAAAPSPAPTEPQRPVALDADAARQVAAFVGGWAVYRVGQAARRKPGQWQLRPLIDHLRAAEPTDDPSTTYVLARMQFGTPGRPTLVMLKPGVVTFFDAVQRLLTEHVCEPELIEHAADAFQRGVDAVRKSSTIRQLFSSLFSDYGASISPAVMRGHSAGT